MQLTPEQQQQIILLIQDGYSNYNSTTSHLAKYNILYSIIDMKCTLCDYKVYWDLKRCIRHHIESADEQDFGYDLISIDKITAFTQVLSLNEQEAILKSFKRALEEHGYEEEKESIALLIKKVGIKIKQKEKFWFVNPFYYASIIATKSLSFISFTILLLFSLETIFLLPAPNNIFTSFNFKPHAYTNSILLNTIISVPVISLSIDDDVKVKPITVLGVLAIMLAKVLFGTIILGFLVKKLEEKTKI